MADVPDPLVIVEYDPRWASEFAALQVALATVLETVSHRIEHVGSTAVTGLAAKPILDLDVVIEEAPTFSAAMKRLEAVGYKHQGDLGVPGREAFSRRGDTRVPRVAGRPEWMEHHLYVCLSDSCELLRHLAFRDHLRGHADDARRYAKLKRELATRFRNDRDAYGRGKAAFVEEILRRTGVS